MNRPLKPMQRPIPCRARIVVWMLAIVPLLTSLPCGAAESADLAETISNLKPSIVGVGTMSHQRRPAGKLTGTGFVVSDGLHVVTNAHVLPELSENSDEFLAILVGHGRKVKAMRAHLVEIDLEHDLALVAFEGPALVPLTLGDDSLVRAGHLFAFTGFPTGTLFGLQAATHRGIVASVTPILGAFGDRDPNTTDASEFLVFQLDATAFPGNSGSPLYRPDDGSVVGVVNKVYVPVTNPSEMVGNSSSGITYAVPIRHVKALLKRADLDE